MPRDPAPYLKVPGHILHLEAVGRTECLGGFTHLHWGQAVAQLVAAMYYKPEVREFDSRWCH
jgi:hypothetical protein